MSEAQPNPIPRGNTPIIGIVGAGVTGTAVGRALVRRGVRVAWFDPRVGAAVRAAGRIGGVPVDDVRDLEAADAVVIAAPPGHARTAERLLGEGLHVVSTTDDLDDVRGLLFLDHVAKRHGVSLVVGAALCPGLSGLLAARLAGQLHVVDEIHVAMHGTGGPACARQHHDALGNTSSAWHDG